MLGTLCTLITLLSCVSGVTVVTQKHPVLAVSKGETATMDCNLGTVTNSDARWYKQVPGGVPQFVLYFHHSYSSPTYGTGFSSSRFTSNHQTQSDYRLIITNVEAGDSAVYYCNTWDNSVNDSRSYLPWGLEVGQSSSSWDSQGSTPAFPTLKAGFYLASEHLIGPSR
ncbi:hypothetical protein AAFF_G00146510 [Aldrovandia affinis]|uniref:Ig-like domain-containing protein n=1 Tax=Aldrovandia affinis TaxID=143900 RepID=A0AAD7VXA9_9TELE|nr:hypothetical protein AAFF_G00146510 [Aldrovandia affinis]